MVALQRRSETEVARIRSRNRSLPREPISRSWPPQTNEEIITESLRELDERLKNSKERIMLDAQA